MALSTLNIQVTDNLPTNSKWTGVGSYPGSQPSTADGRDMCSILSEMFAAVAGGLRPSQLQVCVSSAQAAQASGTVTISGGSGTITATINGVGVPITWATSDTNSAALLAAAINASANALVAGIVTATSAGGVVTITSIAFAKAANGITLAASGTGATASGARLTGGAGQDMPFTAYNLL